LARWDLHPQESAAFSRRTAEADGRQYPLSGSPANRRFLLPGIYYRSNLSLLGHLHSIIHLNTKVANGALQLGVAKKQLHCPKIFCPPVDQGRFGSPH
jgi:hypothetical protein